MARAPRQRIGDDTFWEMVRAWPAVDPDGSSNRDDYLPWIEEQTGAELSDLFDGWLLANARALADGSTRRRSEPLRESALSGTACP